VGCGRSGGEEMWREDHSRVQEDSQDAKMERDYYQKRKEGPGARSVRSTTSACPIGLDIGTVCKKYNHLVCIPTISTTISVRRFLP
jgi:hypothetical protein